MVDRRGLALALAAAVLLCWPMLLVTAPLGFFDTAGYQRTGQGVAAVLAHLVGAGEAEGRLVAEAATAAPAEAGDARVLRSMPYGAFVHLTSLTPLGLVATAVLQTAAVLALLLPLLPGRAGVPAWAVGGGALLVGGLSTLPWFASYVMPDILAAGVVLYFMLLAGAMDAVPLRWRILFAAIAAFAVVSHYGHVPLALGLAAGVLGLRLLARRPVLWPAVLLAVPAVLAVGLNLAGSSVALGEASWAPKRLPILLARSIADGPGARYLQDACPEADLAICRLGPDLPTDMGAFLWSDRGLHSLTDAELDRVRDEEWALLWRIFRAYPGEQAQALLGNAARQLVMVGTGDVQPLVAGEDGEGLVTSTAQAEASPALRAFDAVTPVGTAIGLALCLAYFAWGSPRRGDWELAAVLALGLLGNALIFGGLSAPTDRYQSRVVWLVPTLGVLLWLRRHRVAG